MQFFSSRAFDNRKKGMKRQKKFTLETLLDIKIFLMFLLDNIRHPIDYPTLVEILMKNVDSLSIDYETCLRELADAGHLLYDKVDGVEYYMISEDGRRIASELYDTLDEEFRERSIKSAIKHISLTQSEAKINAYIEQDPSNRYKVTVEAHDKYGQIMSTTLTVNSRAEAELIKSNYENKPDAVYRGILFAATGRLEFFM